MAVVKHKIRWMALAPSKKKLGTFSAEAEKGGVRRSYAKQQ